MPIPAYVGYVPRFATTSDVFTALAEEHRRQVLDTLADGEKAVGEIVDHLAMSQPQVSKHLRVLREVGLVRCRAEGRRRLYRVESAHLRPLRQWLGEDERAINKRVRPMGENLTAL